MKKPLLAIVPALLLSAAVMTAPASARDRRVAPEDLTHYVGMPLFGAAHANLGTVSAADPRTGTIGLTGRHGQFALIHTSVLIDAGYDLRAPTLAVADINRASNMNLAQPGSTIIRPNVQIEESYNQQ